MDYNDTEKNINNEFNYSTAIPTTKNITILVQYCEEVFNSYSQLINEDESKNEKLKYEYRTYQYGKIYSLDFKVVIYDKNFKYIECPSLKSYIEAVNNKQINNVSSLNIKLNINFKRGPNGNTKDHINEFKINFKPYEIIFTRQSNFDDTNILKIENDINEILSKFPAIDTIFCTKE